MRCVTNVGSNGTGLRITVMAMPISSSHLSTGTSISFPGVDMPALVAPRISVVIINYNYAEFVGSAIASALAQRTPPLGNHSRR